MHPRSVFAVASALAISAATSLADPPVPASNGPRVRIDTLERGLVRGRLTGIDAARVVRVRSADGEASINLHDISAIRIIKAADSSHTGPASDPLSGQSTCYLVDGGQVSGRLLASEPRSVRIEPGWGPPVTIPFEALAAVRFGYPADAAADKELASRVAARDPARDQLIVAKGAQPVILSGALEALGPEGWEFRLASRLQKAPLDRAYAVVLGTAPGSPDARPERFVLTSGDAFTGDILEATAAFIRIGSAAFGECRLDWTHIDRIRVRSPLVTWLAETKFKSQQVKSALGVDWTPRVNLNVTGGPIRLGGRTFERGLGVHGTTTVTYRLDGKQSRLQAVIGIDDAVGRRGSVIFRVIGDGRELYKSDVLRGGAKPVDLSVDITGVKVLELSTDAADGLDMGDHANWADLRLIRAAGGGVS